MAQFEIYNHTSTVIQQGYYCLLCDNIYKTLNPLKEHFIAHDEKVSFKYIELWSRKEPKLFEQFIFECVLCLRLNRGNYIDNNTRMLTHCETVHQNSSDLETKLFPSDDGLGPITSCLFCFKGYTNEKMLRLHVKAVHLVKQDGSVKSLIPYRFAYPLQYNFRCKVCKEVLKTYQDLLRHHRTLHGYLLISYTLIISRFDDFLDYVEQHDKLFYCEPCKKEFGRDFYDLLCHAAEEKHSPVAYHFSLSQDGFSRKYPAYIAIQ